MAVQKTQFDSRQETGSDCEFDKVVCEIAEKLEAGEDLHIDEYARLYPELADRLSRVWPTLVAIVDLGHRPVSDSNVDTAPTPDVGILGDFQIRREIGRGGMGVVYEASQLSLGRQVALKVLPFASVMDKRQLQRFKNEAMAAAALEHPNIVSVYATGCERSVHYYAMHLVDGYTLAELITQLRTANQAIGGARNSLQGEPTIDFETVDKSRRQKEPLEAPSDDTKKECQARISTAASIRSRDYFRTVAGIGKQAAEALDYAHGVGIVHRDIKPSNLILDDNGCCWVTDFGLAMVESGPNLTMTGDLLGTLRYMSPEQSLAKRVIIDHRTDIYSLGVTLYELLTLQPALIGDDRQDLLRRLAFEEPTAPRKLNPAIPVDLETVVLKAMSKNPTERYATAAELAADLQHYIDGRSIQARRPTLVQRLLKWSARNRSILMSAGVVLLLATLSLAVGNFLIARQRDMAVAAESRERAYRKVAQHEKARAERHLYLAEMRQAGYDLSNGSLQRLSETLQHYQPASGKAGLRQWEWYYFRSLLPNNLIFTTDNPGSGLTHGWSTKPLLLYTAPGNKYVSVWEPKDRLETARICQQESRVSTCGVHTKSGRIATGSHDGRIMLWSLPDGDLRSTLHEGGARILWLDWSPDGKHLAAYDVAMNLNIWDVTRHQLVATVKLSRLPMVGMREPKWSPSGEYIAVLSHRWNFVVILGVDGTRRDLIADEEHQGEKWYAMEWARAGATLITAGGSAALGGGQVKCWDAATGTLQRAFPEDAQSADMWHISLSPDGTMLASTNNDVVDIWDYRTALRLRQLHGHRGEVNRLNWSPDGSWLATAAPDRTIRLWDVNDDFRPRILQGLLGVAQELRFSPDNAFLVSAERQITEGIRIWPVARAESKLKNALAGEVTNATPSPDGMWIASVERRNPHHILIWNALTGEIVRRLEFAWETDGDVVETRFHWSPNGRSVAWLNRQTVGVWDDTTDQVRSITANEDMLDASDVERMPKTASWSPDGRQIAFATIRDVVVADLQTGHQKCIHLPHRQDAPAIAWGPHNLLAIGSRRYGSDGWIHVWDPMEDRFQQVMRIESPNGGEMVRALVWSPDGRKLALKLRDGLIGILDGNSGALEHFLQGHVGTLRAIAWSPGAKRIASTGDDGTVRLWDVEGGGELLVLNTIESDVFGRSHVAWDKREQRLIWVREDGQFKVWDAGPAYALDAENNAPTRNATATAIASEEADESALVENAIEIHSSPISPEVQACFVDAANCRSRALAEIDRGHLKQARSWLAKEEAILEQMATIVDWEKDAEHRGYAALRWDMTVAYAQAEAWQDAVKLGSDDWKPVTFASNEYRRHLWYYVLALGRTGNRVKAERYYRQLMAQSEGRWMGREEKRLLSEATQMLGEPMQPKPQ